MVKYKTLDDFDVKDKTVLVRVDFNSEIDSETKKVTSDVRIKAHAESTLKELAEKGAKVVVIAHQGRKGDPDYTPLKEHAAILQKLLPKTHVKYVDDVFGDKAKAAIKSVEAGEILVLENVRSWDGETKSGTPEAAIQNCVGAESGATRRLVCKRRFLSGTPWPRFYGWVHSCFAFCSRTHHATGTHLS